MYSDGLPKHVGPFCLLFNGCCTAVPIVLDQDSWRTAFNATGGVATIGPNNNRGGAFRITSGKHCRRQLAAGITAKLQYLVHYPNGLLVVLDSTHHAGFSRGAGHALKQPL